MALSYLAQSARLCCAHRVAAQPRRSAKGGKYTVTSPAMKQLERRCEPIPPPRPPLLQKVTIVGAATPVGKITALFLKQQNIIKYLALYDDCHVLGYSNDIAHIDTSTAIEAYQGRRFLKNALHGAAVVLLCSGYQPFQSHCCAGVANDELFLFNSRVINSLMISIAEFAPEAIVCVQTPPVDCTFTLCKYIMKKNKSYDKRRLLGVNALAAMRANKLYCEIENTDPTKSFCPCICGTGSTTVVPVFSRMHRFVCQKPEDIEKATQLVREADQIVLDAKCHSDGLGTHLSTGFSTARFVVNVMKGIYGGKNEGLLDSALVEQDNPEACFGMKYCACPVSIGRLGINSYFIPTLSAKEKDLLDESRKDLEEYLSMGKSYVNGENIWKKRILRGKKGE